MGGGRTARRAATRAKKTTPCLAKDFLDAVDNIADGIVDEVMKERDEYVESLRSFMVSPYLIGLIAELAGIIPAGQRLPPTHPEAEYQLKEWARHFYAYMGIAAKYKENAKGSAVGEWATTIVKSVHKGVEELLKEQAKKWGLDWENDMIRFSFRVEAVWFVGLGPHYVVKFKGRDGQHKETRLIFSEYATDSNVGASSSRST